MVLDDVVKQYEGIVKAFAAAFAPADAPSVFVSVPHATSNVYDWKFAKFAASGDEAESDALELAATRRQRVVTFRLVAVTESQTPEYKTTWTDVQGADDGAESKHEND